MKRYLGSIALASALASSAYAVDVGFLGDIGLMYNQGLTSQSEINGEKHSLVDLSGRFGVEFKWGKFSLGFGGIGAGAVYEKPDNYGDAFFKDYGDLSDAFIKYDGEKFKFAGGRYDSTFMDMPWISGLVQGAGTRFDLGNIISIYFTWMDANLDNGFMPNRLASQLTKLRGYYNDFDGYRNQINEVFHGGIDLKFGAVEIDPTFLYRMGDLDLLQAGGKFGLNFGHEGGFQSKTSFHGLYQDDERQIAKDDSYMIWFDQEFWISKWRIGGGVIVTGDENFVSYSDKTRYYGGTFGRYAADNFKGGVEPYFTHNAVNWYVETGLDFDRFKFDFLYGDGDYSEISAIMQGSIVKTATLQFDIGGGYVRTDCDDNLTLFTKVSF